jgi:hypothetical protein
MLAAAAATSTGGLAAFSVKHFFNPTEIIKQTKQNK